MNKNNILTFMVTCYNQESVIGETIKSLVEQDTEYQYKILISDDCSTDNSYQVLQEYAEKYEFVKVIQVKNKKKVGRNRNNLLSNVDTEYCCFVDGDDVQKNNYADNIIKALGDKPIYHLKGFDEVWENHTKRKKTLDYENVFLYVFSQRLIKNVRFNEDIMIGEDYLFSLQYYNLLNNDFEYIDDYYQLNRKDDNVSLTKNGDIHKRLELEKSLFEEINKFEGTNQRVTSKINEKKIDIINYCVLLDEPIKINTVNLIGVRDKHKISYMAYRILYSLHLKKAYKYFVKRAIFHKL